MHRAGNGEQLLVGRVLAVPGHRLVGVLAEVVAVRLVAMHYEDGAPDLVAVLQDRLVQEGHAPDAVPAVVGVEAPRMIAAPLVVLAVVSHKERGVIGNRQRLAASRPGILAGLELLGAQSAQLLLLREAGLLAVLGVKVAVCF